MNGDDKQLPFVTKPMLEFQHGASLQLVLEVYANDNSKIELVGMTKEGPFMFSLEHAGDLALETKKFPVPDLPIWVSIRTGVDTVLRGDVHASVSVSINDDIKYLLAQGYVSRMHGVSWPAITNGGNLSGRGLIRSFLGTDPAANTEITETVPTNTSIKIKAFYATLVADANVATRKIRLKITDGTNDLMEIAVNGTQAAGETRRYSWVEAGRAESSSAGSCKMGILPSDLLLPEGYTVETVTDSKQVGDNWSAPRILFEQFITP